MLRLIFIRHGEYDIDTGKLTPEGRDSIRRAGERMAQNGIMPDALYAGLNPRQLESAQILREVFTKTGFNKDIIVEKTLSDGAEPGEFSERALKEKPDDIKTMICVSSGGTILSNCFNFATREWLKDRRKIQYAETVEMDFDVEHWSEADKTMRMESFLA